MVALYFGLPGAGKTTMMCSLAHKELTRRKRRYDNVYGNVEFNIDGYSFIDTDCIGKYDLSNSLILIDEATISYSPRNWSKFCDELVEFFLQHRHMHIDILLFTQRYDGVDLMIRSITDRVYHLYKGYFTGFCMSYALRIPMKVIIPSKKDAGARVGEIIQGYYKPPLLARLFKTYLYRPKYYKYFDSFSRKIYPKLPKKYRPFVSVFPLPDLDTTVITSLSVSELNHVLITYLTLYYRSLLCDPRSDEPILNYILDLKAHRFDVFSLSTVEKRKLIFQIRRFFDAAHVIEEKDFVS